MNRGALYAVIAVLVVAVVGAGIYMYREETKPGIEMKINEDGLSIEQN